MKNIKIVDVYTGYAENSISWIKEDKFEGEFGFIEIVNDVFKKYVVDKMREDEWEEFSDDGEEFYEVCGIIDGVGFISYGEEDLLLVIEEGSKWYSKVDELNLDSVKKSVDFSNGKYDGSLWEEWVELIEESFEKLIDQNRELAYNYSMEDVIEREFLKIVKALKDDGESDKEGIVNLSHDNMMTNVSMTIKEIDKKKIDSLFDQNRERTYNL